jgi:hypothetical protein
MMISAAANAAPSARLRAPKRRASGGMMTDDSRMPAGDMAALRPITSSE